MKLDTNTVLNATGVVLLGLLSFFGHEAWDDIKDTKDAVAGHTAKFESIQTQLTNLSGGESDHENRIRILERDDVSTQDELKTHETRLDRLTRAESPKERTAAEKTP